MKKLIVLSAFFSCSLFAGQGLDMLESADDALLEKSRGMSILVQSNDSQQGGIIGESNMSDLITGSNTISPGAFNNAHGILMINLVSGNSNISNMSSNINIISVK
jgi:hypothetical protein